MVSTKLAFVLLVALGACQVQAAHVAAQPNIDGIIDLISTIINSVSKGITNIIENIRGLVDQILAELNPELRDKIKALLDDAEQLFKKVDERIQNLEKKIMTNRATLKSSFPSCTEEADNQLIEEASAFGGQVATIYKETIANAQNDILIFIEQVKEIVANLHNTNIRALNDTLGCFEEINGFKNCILSNTQQWEDDLTSIVLTLVLDVTQVYNAVSPSVTAFVDKIKPVNEEILANVENIIGNYCDCAEGTA